MPFPSPGHLPHPGIEYKSPPSPAVTGGFFTTEPPGKPTRKKRGDVIRGMKKLMLSREIARNKMIIIEYHD